MKDLNGSFTFLQTAQRGSAGIVRGRTACVAWQDPLEHLIFYQAFKEKVYMSLHGLPSKSAIANGRTRLLSKYAKEGNKTQVCTQFEQREDLWTCRLRWARSNFMVTIPALAASHLSRRKRSVGMPLHGYVEQKCIYENIGTWKHCGALRCETAFQHSALGRVLGPLKGKATSRPNCETLALYIMVGITSGWIGVYNFLFIIA